MRITIVQFLSLLFDKLENLMVRSPRLLGIVIRVTPSVIFIKLSEIKAVGIFHYAVDEVPAYKEYLKSKNCQSGNVYSFSSFLSQVPITTKESYIAILKQNGGFLQFVIKFS